MIGLFCFAAAPVTACKLDQDQENLPKFQQERCFKCGSAALYSADCAIPYDVSYKASHFYCSDCFS
jgi:hypothetical protein